MKRVILTEMPKSGQFVAIWDYNGLPWASVYRWKGNTLLCYDEDSDGWEGFEWDDHTVTREPEEGVELSLVFIVAVNV